MKQSSILIKNIFTLLSFFCIYAQQVKPQNITIWTIGGDSIVTQLMAKDTVFRELKYLTSTNKWKTIDTVDLFSIVKQDGTETMFYKPLNNEDRTVNQMRLFVKGGNYGGNLSSRGAFAAGFISGLATMAIPPANSFLSPIVPLGTIICVAKFSPRKPSPTDDIYFSQGYVARRKNKNTKASIFGGISGLVVGIVCSFLIYH